LRNDRPEFHFEPRFHDNGDKVVLGQTIKAGGQDEGRRVVHLLATHPATARFISTKLVRRFVADEPPADLVERAAAVFKKTDGDIREVVRAIVTSPEFGGTYRNLKVKRPRVRAAPSASGAAVDDAIDLARRIADMGMPLHCSSLPPATKTRLMPVSTSGLLARPNFAPDLAGGRVGGTARMAGPVLGSPEFQRR
jgi:uncharacterized protein (DUF1800 family)